MASRREVLTIFMPSYPLVVPVSGDMELGRRGRGEGTGKDKGDGYCSAGSPAASPCLTRGILTAAESWDGAGACQML